MLSGLVAHTGGNKVGRAFVDTACSCRNCMDAQNTRTLISPFPQDPTCGIKRVITHVRSAATRSCPIRRTSCEKALRWASADRPDWFEPCMWLRARQNPVDCVERFSLACSLGTTATARKQGSRWRASFHWLPDVLPLFHPLTSCNGRSLSTRIDVHLCGMRGSCSMPKRPITQQYERVSVLLAGGGDAGKDSRGTHGVRGARPRTRRVFCLLKIMHGTGLRRRVTGGRLS